MPEAMSTKADEFATVIGPDAQFKGELSFQGGVRIDGQFEGAIQTPGKVFVSKGGKVRAEVKAGSVALEGLHEGNLTADDRVELRASSQLRGDLRATKLLVVEGASFVGRCEVGPNVATEKAAARPAGGEAAEPMRPVAAAAAGAASRRH
jgi:cytoskeletal protein CcmA (bactofilin family)